ncbi:murein biosynthesis integral membrane protein MurJ [Bdellovibrio bacteriovorus]
MASGTLTSRILGLLRDMALGALFDRMITDAWSAAFRIPNFFRRLLGEGSLSVSFIPVFIEAKAADPHGPRAQNLANGLYTLLLVFLGALTLLGIVFADQIFQWILADTYLSSPEKWELTVRMGRIMFGFIFFICTYAYFMGVLNALGSFGLPAVASALLNVSMLAFTFMPAHWFPRAGDGLAWGVLVGGILQASVVWWALRSTGHLPRFKFTGWSSDLKAVFRNLVPGLVGMGLTQFTTLINLYFASSLPEGSISYIYWADRLLELPLSLVSVSLGAALLPTLSDFASSKDKEKFLATAQDGFLMNLFLSLPAALGLYFLAEPIIEVLFLRGRFTFADVVSTAAVLKIYAVSLVLIASSRVLMPLYYSVKNTWYPAAVSILSLALHIGMAKYWMEERGLQGLIISSTLAALLNFFLLFAALPKWNLSFISKDFFIAITKFLIASAGLILAIQFHQAFLAWTNGSMKLIALTLTILLAATTYLTIAHILKVPTSLLRPHRNKN